MKPIYTAASPDAAPARYQEFAEKWGKPYPVIKTLWDNAWEQFTPFLDYDVEIRTVLCSMNAIESLNARFRRAVTVRGHFPTEQAALKTLSGRQVARSQGHRPGTMGHTLEARTQRVRRHLRRPHAQPREPLTMKTAVFTENRTDPPGLKQSGIKPGALPSCTSSNRGGV